MKKFYKKGHLAKHGKRWLALLMSVCLIGTMIPVTARAETAENIGTNENLTKQTAGKLITTWQWIDEEEYLDEETGSLALPGASEEMPAHFEDVTAFLPTQIQATVENTEDTEAEVANETITLGDWECDNYPEAGAYTGSYTFTAALPNGYALSGEAEALEVLVELGGAQMYESTETGNFTVTGGTLDTDYTYADGVLKIIRATPITIANTAPNTATTDRIEVADGVNADITLDGVNIDVSSSSDTAAFKIADNSSGDVTITLADGSENTLKSGANCAGLQKNGAYTPENEGKLTIQGGENGTGKLAATGGEKGAGIGAGYYGTGSNITISGGTVTATGNNGGAGIGGGHRGSGGCGDGSNIEISGGTVTASSSSGAGIGGGYQGYGSEITIIGGTVTASSSSGAGIGGGYQVFGKKITIIGGTVTASSSSGAGIGGGNEGEGSDITIRRGSVKASGANAIGGGSGKEAVTPTSDDTTEVYLLTIANPDSKEVLIDGVSYKPVNHKAVDESDGNLYAYLSGEPHLVKVGEKLCYYVFDSDSKAFVAIPFIINSTNSDTLTYNTDYTYAENVLTIKSDKAVTIKNADPNTAITTDRIMVASGISANITLAGVNIDVSSITNPNVAFKIADNSTGDVTITLADDSVNTLISGFNCAGLQKNGADSDTPGTLTIQGGTSGTGKLTVIGGMNGAGIGGGNDKSGSNITISGGTVTATSDMNGAGIGGGSNGSGSNITISGGSVKVVAGANAKAIGGGYNGGGAVTPTNGTKEVYLLTIANPDSAEVFIDGVSYKPVNHKAVDSNDTNLYAYLTGNTHMVKVGEKTCLYVFDSDSNTFDVAPLTVSATNGGTLTYGTDYTYENNVLTIKSATPITIANADPATATTDRIEVAGGVSANITLTGVKIDVSSSEYTAAFKIADNSMGNVTITLADGTENTLKSGMDCAGLQKNGDILTGTLTIQGGTEGTGNLTAIGGQERVGGAAGIGGGSGYSGSNITIIGGTVTAISYWQGAGIGGSNGKNGSNITINGGTVTATGGEDGAGIGGGTFGFGSNITIKGGTVTATGGSNGAGIGGGYKGSGSDITIEGGTVTATGDDYGAGIGGGNSAFGSNITISGGTVTATGGYGGAGIGGGNSDSGSNITISGGTVTAKGGEDGAGIGGGYQGSGSDITISGGSVKAVGAGTNDIGGNGAVTPTNGTTEVYLFEIANDSGADITINGEPYPTNHNGEKKIYAYLPAKIVTDPNVVNVGTEETKYIYNNSKWLIVSTGAYDVDGFCTNYKWKDGSLVLKDGIADDHTDCNGYQPATDSDSDGVYEIGNAGQLYWFAALVNGTDGLTQNLGASAVLTADITVNTGNVANCGGTKQAGWKDWTPIVGNSYPNNYAGTFDGQNHTVSGLYFNDSNVNDVGLFGATDSSGKISNVGVVDSYFCGKDRVGGVCGSKYGTVENCYSASTVSGEKAVGGVCGNNFKGNLLNCYNTGTVNCSVRNGWYIGGVCGILNSGTIQNCYSTGTVSGSYDSSVGGVCGLNQGTSANISNCYFDSSKCDKNAVGITNNGTVEKTEGKTTEQFASGEVAFLLNGSTSENPVWYQNIDRDGETADAYPVLDSNHGTVHQCTNCTGTYSNTQDKFAAHSFKPDENDSTTHTCEKCGTTESHSTTNLTYSADVKTNRIIVYCNEGGCGTNIGYVELAAPSGEKTYDGTAKVATVSDTVDGVDFSTTPITYKQGETTLSSAPTDAGSYTASITLGTGIGVATVSVEFTIEKATPTLGDVSVTSLSDTLDTNQVVFNRSNTSVSGTFAFKDVTTLQYGTHDYSYVFTPTGTDEVNYKPVEGTVSITVNDTIAPTAEYQIGENEWKKFVNSISFGLFCKDYKTVEIQYSDVNASNEPGSGVKTKQYCIANKALTTDEIADLQWNDYTNAISLNAEGVYFIYVKVEDNAGNKVVLNSEGIVIYAESTLSPASMDYTYKENTDREVQITLNGNTFGKLTDGAETEIAASNYEIDASGKLTLNAAYLDTLNVGQYTYKVYMNPQGQATDKVTLTYSFVVNVKAQELTVTGATATDRVYDTTNVVAITAVTLSGVKSGEDVSVNITNLTGTLSSANVGEYTSVTLSEMTLTGTDAGNYTLVQPTGAVPTNVTISKADAQITVDTGKDSYSKTFGDAAFPLSGISDTNTEANVQYAVTAGEDVVSVSNGTVTILKAGTATITVSLPASTNYNAAEDKTITVTVAKRSGYTVADINKSYLYSRDNAENIDLSEYLPSNCGTVTYGTPLKNGDLYTDGGQPEVSPNGKLSYTVKQAETYGAAGTIQVTVTSDNYADFTITVNVKLIDQIPVSLKEGSSVTLQNSTLTYGQALSTLTFNSAVFVDGDGKVVTGTLAWKTPDEKPNAGTTSATWVFTPNDASYATVEDTVGITVNKATPAVSDTAVPTVAGRTYNPNNSLTDDDLVAGESLSGVDGQPLAGSWSWQTAGIIPTVNNSGYVAVFTPSDTANYNTVTRTITVAVSKATPHIAAEPTAADITYGDTLGASALTGGTVQYSGSDTTTVSGSFAWADSSMKPSVSDSNIMGYRVVFTPSDADNYNAAETYVTLIVNKAENAPNMPSTTINVANSVTKVSDVTLPTDWVWQDADKDTALTVGTAVTATAEYNGADKGNYVNETVSVSITRSACDHAHTEVRNAKEATCTETGYTGDTYCTDCGAVTATGTATPALGHNYTGKVTTEPTCTDTGIRTYTCSCGDRYTETIPALGHDYASEFTVDVDATCRNAGSKSRHCIRCDAKTDVTSMEKTAHTAAAAVRENEIAATAAEAGSYDSVVYCSVCRQELSRTKVEIPATGAGDSGNTGDSGSTEGSGNAEGSGTTQIIAPDGSVITKTIVVTDEGTLTKTETVSSDGSVTTETALVTDAGSITHTETIYPDNSVTVTTQTVGTDGTVNATTTTTGADGLTTTITATTAADGSAEATMTSQSVNSKGKLVTATLSATADATGAITDMAETTLIPNAAKNTDITIVEHKDANGVTVKADAIIVRTPTDGKTTIAGSVLTQIKEEVGKGIPTEITVRALDEEGKTLFTVKGSTASLKTGTTLYLYRQDVKTGKWIAVNDDTYKVNSVGSVTLSDLSKATYRLVTGKEAKEIQKQLKQTIALKKTSATLAVGKTTTVALKDTLDKRSVKSITYTSSDKKVATVDKNGKVTAKAAGTATIKVRVILKDGTAKNVTMKVTVK